MWPALSGAELVNDLFGFRALVRSAARRHPHRRRAGTAAPPPRARHRARRVDRGRHRARRRSRHAARPDRGGAGRRSAAGAAATTRSTPRHRVIENLGLHGYADAATLAERFGEPSSERPRHDRRAAHVRPRARRRGAGPHRDAVAHARPALPVGFDDARRRPGPGEQAGRGRVVGRGARAAADAQPAALRHAHDQLPHAVRGHGRRVTTARGRGARRSSRRVSVRSTGEEPRFVAAPRGELVADRRAARAATRSRAPGTVAVIAPDALHAALVAALADLGAPSAAADALDAPIAVLDPTSAKGLEFDHVVVVEPVAARHRRPRRACACSTSRSPARRRR